MRVKHWKSFVIITISFLSLAVFQALISTSHAHGQVPAHADSSGQIPAELIGKWRVVRELPTNGVTCWDEKQAQALIGTEIEYGKDSLQWGKIQVKAQNVQLTTFDAEQFFREYSGSGGGIRFGDLGITTQTVRLVKLQHLNVSWKDHGGQEHYEIPGDWALLKASNRIVLSVCNVCYEAKRLLPVKQH
jgi:hypothetical protein